MRIVKRIGLMQQVVARWRRAGQTVGFVPTMGSLHAGHLSLVARARRLVGPQGQVVVSIYVNPSQFGRDEDFTRYPRDLKTDARLCRDAGVDVLFAPADAEMYPSGPEAGYSTYVVEERLSRSMEGAARPGHFRGVTTVVTKLFHIVDPDVAVFGQKDYQQAAIIQRMVRDLNFRVRIVVAPTKREADGLAMSSRNPYLSNDEREQATALWKAIRKARELVRRSRRLPARNLEKALRRSIEAQPAARVDYIAFFDPASLGPVKTVEPGTHLALAVFLGETRLIDNGRL